MPVGHHFMKKEGMRTSYVETSYHESLMGELLLSHSVHDFCIIGKENALKIQDWFDGNVLFKIPGLV